MGRGASEGQRTPRPCLFHYYSGVHWESCSPLPQLNFFTYKIMSIVPSCWVVLKIKGSVFGESEPVPGSKWRYSSLLSVHWKHTHRQI